MKNKRIKKFFRTVRNVFRNANLLLASVILGGIIPSYGFSRIYERYSEDKKKFIEEIKDRVEEVLEHPQFNKISDELKNILETDPLSIDRGFLDWLADRDKQFVITNKDIRSITKKYLSEVGITPTRAMVNKYSPIIRRHFKMRCYPLAKSGPFLNQGHNI